MTATVTDLNADRRAAMRREADGIAAARADAIRSHPSSQGRRAQVERQQQLGALVAALGDGRLDVTDERDLPLIVGVLLACAPQARSEPALVAKFVTEAAESHRNASTSHQLQDDERAVQRLAADAAFCVSELAAGTAYTATHPYLLHDCQMLVDWLTAAVAR